MKNILIVGANSAIATACARIWAAEKSRFFLVARNVEKLEQVAADLDARGASEVKTFTLDMNDFSAHEEMLGAAFTSLGRVDICLVAHGTLPSQAECERDLDLALREFSSNGLSVIALLTRLANRMEEQRTGTIAVISSVAGDRGRPSNYLYGTAKAAISTFCEGLRARLFKVGVHVLTIKPGFVDTPMTQGLSLPKLLLATPPQVARDITRAIDKRRNSIYTPWFWSLIMLLIRNIPTALFKKTNI
ncbi:MULTISPECIES: SDR family oxidoreductase [Pseudomonas]|jgi:short-subunit dehydrogenase|uniref:SDR family oxidoreductase n=1 Tax=Pseudomonas TaxID=286 RepID=UPI0002A3D653|nr:MULTISPECIES: SDR family oxidoreductase [Pseudomonas]KWR74831.1 short-chain dehydrogenase [Pseudomonas sp. PI1]MBB1608546.1 short-chain dehydrogenase [Pseudomonas sp. UMC76]MBB1637237.1 short-chain dehydrogenase [Pseudomonas sp. UME83]NTX90250.1 SDR family oxidoreductase [Pseudomonas sp. UMA643]NTY21130.1 SDR family oxidoreductase [Pseudomonas sp. UMC3103]